MPRMRTFLALAPVMTKPAISVLSPGPVPARVEMFARRAELSTVSLATELRVLPRLLGR